MIIDGLISPFLILKHLQEYLPSLTDAFSDNIDIAGTIIDGDPQILRIVDNGHGLSTGQSVVLINSRLDNLITNVEQFQEDDGDILRFTTGLPHDLTFDYNDNTDDGKVELRNFTDSQFNGFFELSAVPSRTTFEIKKDNLPILNGSEALREQWEVGIDGIFPVTVIDANTYEITLTGKPEFTPIVVPQLQKAINFDMHVVADIDRANAIYTPKNDNDLSLFVIMNDMAASKDRNIESDATQSNTTQNPSRILNINTFTIVVFFPTINSTSGGAASQKAWDDILVVIMAAMAGVRFSDFDNTSYITTMIGHGSTVYNNAYYGHGYDFEYCYEVTNSQSFVENFIKSRAFRDNGLSFTPLEEGSTIDLDG